MRTIANFLRAVQAINIAEVAADSMYDTANNYVGLQRDQLLHGFDSQGNRLTPYKNPLYAKMKNQKNSLPGLGNPDLKLTGSFYNNMMASPSEEGLVVYSLDDKSQQLEEKYGKTIFTLGTDWRKDYFGVLRPTFINNVVTALAGQE